MALVVAAGATTVVVVVVVVVIAAYTQLTFRDVAMGSISVYYEGWSKSFEPGVDGHKTVG